MQKSLKSFNVIQIESLDTWQADEPQIIASEGHEKVANTSCHEVAQRYIQLVYKIFPCSDLERKLGLQKADRNFIRKRRLLVSNYSWLLLHFFLFSCSKNFKTWWEFLKRPWMAGPFCCGFSSLISQRDCGR